MRTSCYTFNLPDRVKPIREGENTFKRFQFESTTAYGICGLDCVLQILDLTDWSRAGAVVPTQTRCEGSSVCQPSNRSGSTQRSNVYWLSCSPTSPSRQCQGRSRLTLAHIYWGLFKPSRKGDSWGDIRDGRLAACFSSNSCRAPKLCGRTNGDLRTLAQRLSFMKSLLPSSLSA